MQKSNKTLPLLSELLKRRGQTIAMFASDHCISEDDVLAAYCAKNGIKKDLKLETKVAHPEVITTSVAGMIRKNALKKIPVIKAVSQVTSGSAPSCAD